MVSKEGYESKMIDIKLGGVPENFANYFVIEFNRPFKGKIVVGKTRWHYDKARNI